MGGKGSPERLKEISDSGATFASVWVVHPGKPRPYYRAAQPSAVVGHRPLLALTVVDHDHDPHTQ